jgi:hypothetical protein
VLSNQSDIYPIHFATLAHPLKQTLIDLAIDRAYMIRFKANR